MGYRKMIAPSLPTRRSGITDDYLPPVNKSSFGSISEKRALLLAYHEFYLGWRRTVSDSRAEYSVDAFLEKGKL